jgi:hypothetical protein
LHVHLAAQLASDQRLDALQTALQLRLVAHLLQIVNCVRTSSKLCESHTEIGKQVVSLRAPNINRWL